MKAEQLESLEAQKELSNFGMGRLILSSSQREVAFQPFELSRYGMGILAANGISHGSVMVLDNPKGRVYLHVVDSCDYEGSNELRRYQLLNLDQEVDMEDMFARFANQPSLSALRFFEPIRFARFSTDPGIIVHAKTFGTIGFYQLNSVNVSRTGMLVSAGRDRFVPFLDNTLVEFTLVPRGDWLFQPVHGLAKVVRIIERKDNRTGIALGYGIKFIEFQDLGQDIWDKTVRFMENRLSRQVYAESILP